MMSKAAYMMQDQLRRNYALITDVHSPNVFLVRGCLPFPQGLAALTLLFRGKLAADVYSHPYFIEKQSNPAQPSPQLHLTEECQSLMKMIKGLHFMKDDSSKLDNTMVFVTDYSIMARGKMLTFTNKDDDVTELVERSRRNGESEEEWQHRALRLRWRKTALNRRNNNQSPSSGFSSAEHSFQPFTRQSHLANDQQIMPERLRRFVERDGGHTVLYNPIDTDPKTFDATIRKLNDEERVVKTIVVPTRQGWGGVRAWAEAFPDACILCSGDAGRSSNPQQEQEWHLQNQGKVHRAGGCIDMGNGVTGLSFPEVEEQELLNAESGAATAVCDSENICSLYSHQLPVHVRHSADDELRSSSRPETLGTVEQRQITPNIELVRIAGDDQTNEYVLYDHNSGALACTDLFHGEYSDLDPVNSWMCRVWFKFMKGGDYKRVDVVPQFKWLHVKQHGNLVALHESIEMLTKSRPVKYLLYAHGTPPRIEEPANALRLQWGLPPLQEQHQKIMPNEEKSIKNTLSGANS